MILFEDRASTVLYKVLKNIKNKKFILPLNVCPIVPDTFLRANKEFVFCDISLDTLSIDQKLALEMMQNDKSIDGILFVKTFGIEFDIQPFYKKIKEYNKNIFIIDDMCPCIQQFDYDINNSFADMALFSSGYSKYIDIGYGGYGFVKESQFENIFNDKANTVEFEKYKNTILEKIPLMKEHKNQLNKIYSEGIDERYHLGDKFNNWRFSILVDDKDKILDEIFKINGLFASSHYSQVDYAYVTTAQTDTNAHKIHSKIVNLFNDFRFTQEKAHQVVKVINNELNKD